MSVVMREHDLIATYFRPLAHPDISLGLRDDAACVDVSGMGSLVVTTDMLCEGIHFLPHTRPDDLAWKALAVNVSDLAAMGAMPHAYQLALGLSARQDTTWVEAFCTGLTEAQHAFAIGLSGGDTIRGCPALSLSITAHGVLKKGRQPLTRCGARPGDHVYVSGTLGDAALGLHCIRESLPLEPAMQAALVQRYLRPTPRIALGQALQGIATACMDISDGLMMDAQKLCTASGVGMMLELEQCPLSLAAQAVRDADAAMWQASISAGDDYELLFTVPPEMDVTVLRAKADVAITRIGTVEEEAGCRLIDGSGEPVTLPNEGYSH